MRVGLSTSVMERGRSGAAQYILGLVRALLECDRAPELVLFVLQQDLPCFTFAAGPAQIVPVAERHRPAARLLAWHQFVLPRLARRLGLEVLHVPGVRLAPWWCRCGIVATVADVSALGEHGWRRGMSDTWSRLALARLARRRSELVTFGRRVAAEVARDAELEPARVTIVPNGVDHGRFHPGDREQAARELARRHGVHPPFFLCVARLRHPAKNHLPLIAAFNQLKAATPSPWQLVLLGADGPGAELVHTAIQRSPYAPDIRCPGDVPPEEVPAWYRAAGAVVQPAGRDGFGLVPLEAMACGCAVLVARGGPAEEVGGPAVLSVGPGDAGALQQALTRLALDKSLRTRLGTAALARAADYDWRRTAGAMREIYARAAHRSEQPAPGGAPLTTVLP